MRAVWIFMGMLACAGPGAAQDAHRCTAVAPPPAEFAAWGQAAPLTAATTPAAARARLMPLGQARRLTLAFASAVTHAAPPERPDAGAGKAGMVAFDVPRAATYRIALSAGAWIEMVRDGRTTRSVGHGHGPECSGIRKIVDFPLKPGRYILQLSASAAPDVTAMIVQGTATAAP